MKEVIIVSESESKELYEIKTRDEEDRDIYYLLTRESFKESLWMCENENLIDVHKWKKLSYDERSNRINLVIREATKKDFILRIRN